MTDLPIIFEDNDLLVINKPAGMIVNRATSHHETSLQDLMVDYLHLADIPSGPIPDATAPPEAIFAFRQGMVHRLDKDTSGVILWAKNPTALVALLHQFQKREVHKTYLCLVHGLLNTPEGRINLPLARKATNRQIMSVSPAGRPAITTYQVQSYYHGFDATRLKDLTTPAINDLKPARLAQIYQGFTLLAAQPLTGRTHQIRAHFTHRGHPLVGDTAYLPRRKARLDPLWCPRQFLHAASITFTHPLTKETFTLTTPLPKDLQEALTWLTP